MRAERSEAIGAQRGRGGIQLARRQLEQREARKEPLLARGVAEELARAHDGRRVHVALRLVGARAALVAPRALKRLLKPAGAVSVTLLSNILLLGPSAAPCASRTHLSATPHAQLAAAAAFPPSQCSAGTGVCTHANAPCRLHSTFCPCGVTPHTRSSGTRANRPPARWSMGSSAGGQGAAVVACAQSKGKRAGVSELE